MAEKLGLGNEVRELKIGQSFTNPRSTSFHTVRYDFKPASVDTNKKATVDVGDNHQITVTVPHLDGSGTAQTVFKGSQRPYTKECVLIIDRVTGEITLEKLACNIQVKKTRSEYNKMPIAQDRLNQQSSSASDQPRTANTFSQRSATPPIVAGHRVSSKTRVTSGHRRPDRPITQLAPKHSPLRASPNHPSPVNPRSPGRSTNREPQEVHNNNHSTLASLPMIGMDDFADPAPPQHYGGRLGGAPSGTHNINENNKPSPTLNLSDGENRVGTISDSSSSSSDSDSDSDNDRNKPPAKVNGYSNGAPKMNGNLGTLDEDLCLSESGSDSE